MIRVYNGPFVHGHRHIRLSPTITEPTNGPKVGHLKHRSPGKCSFGRGFFGEGRAVCFLPWVSLRPAARLNGRLYFCLKREGDRGDGSEGGAHAHVIYRPCAGVCFGTSMDVGLFRGCSTCAGALEMPFFMRTFNVRYLPCSNGSLGPPPYRAPWDSLSLCLHPVPLKEDSLLSGAPNRSMGRPYLHEKKC